ncbi:MAG: rhomboid family intramembrane serine protease [Phycisphaerales bacterium]|nr:rhomboid family intramembrane serine protease [Phycisphaerales bacterium]
MLIPLGTDRLPPRRAITTSVLIALNLLAFVGMMVASRSGFSSLEETLNGGAVSRTAFQPWTLITYQFLHDPNGLGHIGFNMLFLWVFGQAVESRLGHWGFAAFYLIGGIAAALAHMATSPAPAIGASGSVAAVSGAFLALFPRATVRVLLFFFLIGIYHIPALWFIAFYIAIDIFSQFAGFFGRSNDVANAAHLGGYLFGFSTSIALLAIGVLPRTDLDALFLFKQYRRRAAMRSATREYGSGFDSTTPDTAPPRGIESEKRKDAVPELVPVAPDEHAEDRRTITEALRRDDSAAAVKAYRAAPPTLRLADGDHAEIGNRAMAIGDAEVAVRAYTGLLERRGERTNGPGGSSDEIRLLLSSILIRRLGRPSEARSHLQILDTRPLSPEGTALRDALKEEMNDA